MVALHDAWWLEWPTRSLGSDNSDCTQIQYMAERDARCCVTLERLVLETSNPKVKVETTWQSKRKSLDARVPCHQSGSWMWILWYWWEECGLGFGSVDLTQLTARTAGIPRKKSKEWCGSSRLNPSEDIRLKIVPWFEDRDGVSGKRELLRNVSGCEFGVQDFLSWGRKIGAVCWKRVEGRKAVKRVSRKQGGVKAYSRIWGEADTCFVGRLRRKMRVSVLREDSCKLAVAILLFDSRAREQHNSDKRRDRRIALHGGWRCVLVCAWGKWCKIERGRVRTRSLREVV